MLITTWFDLNHDLTSRPWFLLNLLMQYFFNYFNHLCLRFICHFLDDYCGPCSTLAEICPAHAFMNSHFHQPVWLFQLNWKHGSHSEVLRSVLSSFPRIVVWLFPKSYVYSIISMYFSRLSVLRFTTLEKLQVCESCIQCGSPMVIFFSASEFMQGCKHRKLVLRQCTFSTLGTWFFMFVVKRSRYFK